MEMFTFKVWFSDGNYEPESVVVYAACQQHALIHAQSDRIKDGLDYTLDHIEKIN